MQVEENKVSRRRLLGWLGVLSVFGVTGAAFRFKKQKKPQTVKMLTQDGQLVEVDAQALASKRRKISDAELKGWVTGKPSKKSFF